jgi:cytochrome b pre-mRNA-processing protein 3
MTDGGDSSGDGGLFSRARTPPPGEGRLRRVLVIGGVLLVSVGVWMWVHGSEGGALRAMSPAQREAFYQETWAAQRAKCLTDAGPTEPASRCRQRAQYLLQFPQCDEACRAELAPWLQAPAE